MKNRAASQRVRLMAVTKRYHKAVSHQLSMLIWNPPLDLLSGFTLTLSRLCLELHVHITRF